MVENPFKWRSVPLSDVISHDIRLEASVFDVEAKQARISVTDGTYHAVPLGGENGLIDAAYYPCRFKRIYCERGNGEAFYLPSQMTDLYPKPDKYISASTNCDIEELRLKPHTLLLTRSGTIGTVSYVSKTIEGKVFSDDVIRITFKNDFDLGYVYTFLKSKTGNLMLTTNGYGSVITHLEPEHLTKIPVPNAPVKLREKINRLIVNSFQLRDESNKLIDMATALLKQELCLPKIQDFLNQTEQKHMSAFPIRLSNMAGRLDASYHLPIVNTIIKHLQENSEEVATIGDNRISRDVFLPMRFKRIYVEEGYGRVLIGGKQLYELDPAGKKYLSQTKHKEIFDLLEVCQNTTLITRSGTIGKVALVPKHWEHWIPSDHIIRIVPANIDIAGYLNIFLASDYGYTLITRYTYGSVIDEIDDNHIRQIPIPLLKNHQAQTKINTLALDANEKRYQAYQLEQKAIKIMETEILHTTE